MEHDHPLSGCRWIGADSQSQSPVLLRRFSAAAPLSATLYITGLGYFSARINSHPVTDHRFQPHVSEYGPRDLTKFLYPLSDRLTYRIYYCTYDITQLLQQGDNTLTIQLGNGWYRQTERIDEGNMSYGATLKAIYCLTLRYPEGVVRVCSDGSETWVDSPIVYSNLFLGETHDFSRTLGKEHFVQVLPDEAASLSPQIGTPDRVVRTLHPKLLMQKEGKRIYDAGENVSGTVRLTARGQRGKRITLQFAENLNADGLLDFVSAGSNSTCFGGKPQIQTDVCICGDTLSVFEPQFCWHGFRYFSLEGPGFEPEVLVIHSDVEVTAEFHSDSEALNFLFGAFLRTQKNNMHGSIPSDCPHRERLGYTGDGQIAAAAAMMTLDTKEFYRKWMQDILDTQDTVTGHVQHTAPLGGGGGGPVGWGGAIAVVPHRFFKQYGDTELLQISWEPIKKWIGYLQTRMDKYLITREEPRGWCLGDWATLEPTVIPAPLVNTCLFIRILDMLVETAPAVGQERDVSFFEALQQSCRAAVSDAYFDAATGQFCGGVQGADAYGLYAGLGDERTAKALVRRYEELGHFDTGFIGTDVLLEVLFSLQQADLAFRLLSSEDMGSFLYMKRHGATTIWEHWDGSESHNHPMFGGCVRHLFEGFLGIRQAYGTGGYRSVIPEPWLPTGLNHIAGSLLTPAGLIRVALRRENGQVLQDIYLP